MIYLLISSSDLKQSRRRILELLPDPHHDTDSMETSVKLYLALLRGFLETPGTESSGCTASKLRHVLRFRWSHSLLGNTPENQSDTAFEMANLLMNVSFWHMKHAGMISAKEE